MIAFAWDGFPQYAARCVGAFVKRAGEGNVIVIATRPVVPIEGMERLCGCPVVWVGADDAVPDNLPKIDSLVVSGWAIPVFNRLCERVRASGGRLVCMNDANYVAFRADPREWCKQLLRCVLFRLKHGRAFDAFFVPGASARRLLRFYGVAEDRIAEGMYSADAALFSGGAPLAERPRRIVYVGQFIPRKNVLRLVEAFRRLNAADWELHLYGSGALESALRSRAASCAAKNVVVHAFVQPETLADVYRQARIFVLPSLVEHWGLVVHEAALTGCQLCLSGGVGAADDLLGKDNGMRFDPRDTDSLAHALEAAMNVSDAALGCAERESRQLASRVSVDRFCAGLVRLLRLKEGGCA